MTKCPECTDENTDEILFCKNCGRCLLTPDPEGGLRSIARQIEHYEIPKGIPFYDAHRIKDFGAVRLVRKNQTEPSVIAGWLVLVNVLVLLLMSEVVKAIIAK